MLLTSGPSKISAKCCEKTDVKSHSHCQPVAMSTPWRQSASLVSLGLKNKSYMDFTTARNLLLAATSMRSWIVVHLLLLSLVSGIMGSKSIPKTVSFAETSFLAQPHCLFRIELTSPRYLVQLDGVFPLNFTCKYTVHYTFHKSVDDFDTTLITGLLGPTSDCQYCLIPPFQHTHNLFSCELRTIICVKDMRISNQSKERV